MNRRGFLGVAAAALLVGPPVAMSAETRKKGVMLLNRIGPKQQELFIANADGTGERKLLQNSTFDYHAAFSADGTSVYFTSERGGLGNSDIFRANADGAGITPIVTGAAIDDAPAPSPDGSKLAFVSSRNGYFANVWVYDLKTKRFTNVTGAASKDSDESLPHGFFRPAWSPNGQWLAFSSDRNTDWRGHDNGAGWEHTQELSIYIAKADGTGFRRIASRPGYCLGTPQWSPDGKRVVFYEMPVEDTWGARRPEGVFKVASQIVSVDVNTGERAVHTTGPGLKLFPQFLSPTEIAYHWKGGPNEGLYYTSQRPAVKRALRSPAWAPGGGKSVIYEKVGWKAWPQGTPLYSWDPEWEYQYTDVFPAMARDGTVAITEKDAGSSIVIFNPDGSNRKTIYDAVNLARDTGNTPEERPTGQVGAFYPAWSPDSQWVAFGVGQWFQLRKTGKAVLMRVRRDGSGLEPLSDGNEHSGFPSYSPDGKRIVFRVWGEKFAGLRVLDLDARKVSTLTTEYDNLPAWSPDGKLIMFTRRVDAVNFDIFTIRPDGSDLNRLTTNRTNDGHAVWTADGKVMWDSGYYGFRDEIALYDNTFQPYGQIWIMNADGSGKRVLTDSLWEDSTPLYLPRKA
jgi:Tol biopolymer transport system component